MSDEAEETNIDTDPQKILSAISNEVRSEILKLLSRKNPLSFTEIMEERGLDPSQDAGRFGYHLRELRKANLIKGGPEVGYTLTRVGDKVVEFLWTLIDLRRDENYIPVRTSGYTIEHFDKKKIVDSLITEASVPEDLANEIAAETEERLLKANIKYLTAPLIREAVNYILIEKGHENYRHSLTRLGLPPYDIFKNLTRKKDMIENFNPEMIHKLAGDAVMEQYLLLNVLDHDVADGYLSGDFYIPNANYFTLRTNSIHHDIRWFLKDGLKYPKRDNYLTIHKPKNLMQALNLILNLLTLSQNFVSGTQVVDFFNIFLLPYIHGMNDDDIEADIFNFLTNTANTYAARGGQLISCCLECDLEIPEFLGNEGAIGPERGLSGFYGDYVDDLFRFNSILLDILLAGNRNGYPLLNPSQIFKLNMTILTRKEFNPLIYKILKVIEKWGTLNFINTTPSWQNNLVSYTNSLERIENRWKKDFKTNFRAVGNLDWIILNLPRIALESDQIFGKFEKKLNDRLDQCLEALKEKNNEIKKHISIYNNLPFFNYQVNNQNYFDINNSTQSLSYMGIYEAANIFLGVESKFDEKIDFIEQILQYISTYINKKDEEIKQNLNIKQTLAGKWSKTLVKLDTLKFGKDKIYLLQKNDRKYLETNFYNPNIPFLQEIEREAKLQKLLRGGHRVIVPISDEKEEDLRGVLNQILQKDIGFFKFSKFALISK
jgi:ribonucleoside-triphosphate reductase